MKTHRSLPTLALLALLSTLNFQPSTVFAQGTAFTYQGRLTHGEGAANGLYEISFALYDAPTNGNVVGTPATVAPVPVSNGLFTATLDFGAAAFMGEDRWLEISVTVFGSDQPVVTLAPRQAITPTPYAIHAANAAGLMSFNSAPLDIKVNGERVLRLEITGSGPNIIGGASVNGVGPDVIGATISGGGTSSPGFEATNRVEANYGTISGGAANSIGELSRNSTVGGGWQNKIHAGSGWSTISGGEANTVQPDARYSTISGGGLNRAGAYGCVIAGGSLNTVQTNAEHSAIGGGLGNWIAANAMFSTIAGGDQNSASGPASTIGGGQGNTNAGMQATIGGGVMNGVEAGAWWATIAGGVRNTINSGSVYGAIGGGAGNSIRGLVGYPTISGGFMNTVMSTRGTISGGDRNSIQTDSEYATIAGGTSNMAAARGAVIGGGILNTNNGYGAKIGGGYQNLIHSNVQYATISGGLQNVVSASGWHSTVGGGAWNAASGGFAAIGGGSYNTAAGGRATISGGNFNAAIGEGATVPGGSDNTAGGHYSFAAGHSARATNNGAFVWGDWTLADITSTNDNSVTFRASGGVRFFSNAGATAGVSLAPGSGSWSSLSDRNAKENFAAANAREILDKVAALPLASWNYKTQGAGVRHLGPMAQNFHAAFGLGESDRTITTVDADGVALAAIQGLNQKVEEKEARLQTLEKELRALKELVAKLSTTRN